MTDVLQVEVREQLGTAATRRLRRASRIPAVLYGHGQPNIHLSVASKQVEALLRHHSKTAQLSGAVDDHVLVSEVQFDPLGIEVLHLDLVRVDLKERVEVSVPVRLHGEAPGLREGGILTENVHEVDVRCSAGNIPEELILRVGQLQLGGQMTAEALELPEGVELLTPAETVLATLEVPRGATAAEEAEEAEAEAAEAAAAESESETPEQ